MHSITHPRLLSFRFLFCLKRSIIYLSMNMKLVLSELCFFFIFIWSLSTCSRAQKIFNRVVAVAVSHFTPVSVRSIADIACEKNLLREKKKNLYFILWRPRVEGYFSPYTHNQIPKVLQPLFVQGGYEVSVQGSRRAKVRGSGWHSIESDERSVP